MALRVFFFLARGRGFFYYHGIPVIPQRDAP